MGLGWRDLMKSGADEQIHPCDRRLLSWVNSVVDGQCGTGFLQKNEGRNNSGCNMKQLFVMPPLPNMMKIKVQIKKNC